MTDAERHPENLTWSELNALTDSELVACLVGGSDTALAVIFDRYHRLLFSITVRILRDEAEAEDMVQTIFLNVFRSAAKFDPARGTLKMWLLQFAYHGSINRRRSLSSRGVYLWEELEESKEQGQVTDFNAGRLCEQLLGKLKPRQREVLELTFYEGRTTVEIAAEQSRPVAHVRHDLYRGLAKLRTALGKPKKLRLDAEVERRGGVIADTPTF
jgi:RNA polymerase sigma-70 factor (ECF subfamily)